MSTGGLEEEVWVVGEVTARNSSRANTDCNGQANTNARKMENTTCALLDTEGGAWFQTKGMTREENQAIG